MSRLGPFEFSMRARQPAAHNVLVTRVSMVDIGRPIEGKLFIGTVPSNRDDLCHDITLAIAVGPACLPDLPDLFEDIMCVPIPDSPLAGLQLLEALPEVQNRISKTLQAGQNVLVCSPSGRSRCAAVVIAYLINRRNMTYMDAYTAVRTARPSIQPNFGFDTMLVNLGIGHRGQV